MSTFKAGTITFVAIAALWFAATRQLDTLDAAPMPHIAPLSTDVEMQISGVTHYEAREQSVGGRNLFGYVVHDPPMVIVAKAPEAAPPAPAPIVDATPVPEPLPQFTYRFIGRFGHERDPLAAFTANGEVITVRRGDRIGDRFTLQNVGIESVDVIDEKGRVVRVRLGE